MPTIHRKNTGADPKRLRNTGVADNTKAKGADGSPDVDRTRGTGGTRGSRDVGGNVPKTDRGDHSRLSLDGRLQDLGVNRKDLRNGVGELFSSAADAAPEAPEVSEPSIRKLYDDPDFKALYSFATDAAATIHREGRHWDQLGQIKNFAAAAAFVTKGEPLPDGTKPANDKALKQRFPDSMAQRAMCHLLLLTMPEEFRAERAILGDGSRGASQNLFNPFPDAVIARADDGFQLKGGDLPKVNPHLTEHLTGPDLLDKIFTEGQRGTFLAPKKYCPGAFLQDRADLNAGKDKADQAGHDGDPIFVRIQDVFTDDDGQKMARVTVPEQHKVRTGWDGSYHENEEVLGQVDHVTDKKGQPVLGPDGQPQPILIPVDDLADYLLDPGNVRGSGKLNLESSRDDRALALCFSHELRNRYLTDSNGITKSVFDWLQEADQRTPRQDIERIKQGAWDAAWDAVTQFAAHPRRVHFALTVDNEPGISDAEWESRNGWKQEALDLLNDCGLQMQDSGQRYARDSSHIGERWENHQISWTSNFLDRGFEGGTLDCYGLADAFDRLSATFLAPMGIISMADTAEGHGASVGRTLSHPDDNGVIQAGIPKKVKPNELIAGFDLTRSSGVGPSAGVYWINFGGYVNIDPPSGQRYDFVKDGEHLRSVVEQLDG